MLADELKDRTRSLALESLRLAERLPKTWVGQVVGRQFLRSATSVGANYRSACRARSRPDFISKMGIVEEEADEAVYWLMLIQEAGMIDRDSVAQLRSEFEAIVRIAVASIRTARRHK